MPFDLFGKKSKANAEILSKENAVLNEKIIVLERKIEELIESSEALMKDRDSNFNLVCKLESDLSKVNSELSSTARKLDAYVSEEEQLLSRFTTEVASGYPNVTNSKLRNFVDNLLSNINLSSNFKKHPIKLEHYFTLKTINDLQKFINSNGLTIRKK